MASPWTQRATPVPRQTEICAITAHDWDATIVAVEGRFVEASNATLLAETGRGERVIYKPVAGARQLWDFDATTLALREVWAYRIDRALGFDLVPETVLGDGPFGPGAVQRFVDAFADETVVDMIRSDDEALWPVALLDVIINNADRKIGHILHAEDGKLWAIDHGLTFHHEDKLRTVLWGFAGMPLPPVLADRLVELQGLLAAALGEEFRQDFGSLELVAIQSRVAELVRRKALPEPPTDRPAVPWPPY